MKKPSTATGRELMGARLPPVRRVGLTCDFLRWSLAGQELSCYPLRNLAWLAKLLNLESRAAAWGVEVKLVHPPAEASSWQSAVACPDSLKSYSENPGLAWAAHFDADRLTMFPAEVSALASCDLVVGFELPKSLRRELHGAKVRYLSLSVHAQRYQRDLCFSAASNCPALSALLSACAVPLDAMAARSRWMLAVFAHASHPAFALPEGLPLCVAQTAQDSVLICKHGFAGWHHFEDEVATRLKDFPTVAVLPHPHRPDAGELVRLLRLRLGKNVVLTNANSYGVICSNTNTPQVLTLSSSLGVEAASLGLASHFLHGKPTELLNLPGIEHGSAEPLGHAVLSDEFWLGAFGLQSASQPSLPGPFSQGDHHIRDSLESWAFGALRHGLSIDTCHKHLLLAQQMADGEQSRLLRTMGGQSNCSSDSEIVRRAARAGVQLSVIAPPLELNQVHDITPEDLLLQPYLEDGFHPPEHWGTWSSAARSRLVIPVQMQRRDETGWAAVSLHLQLFEGLKPTAPVLTICSGGRTLAYLAFREGGELSHKIELLVPVLEGQLVIEFRLTALATPAPGGEHVDSRLLGFGIRHISVDLRIDLPADTRPRVALWGVTAVPVPLAGLEAFA